MQKYLVGGAVRDKILNIENDDLDYVIVGSNVNEMLSLGYQQVGKSFPVFLDENRNQYALARKEISTGKSHTDFKFEIENVSLKDDLFRRDLTINALAMDEDGKLLDFFNGVKDLDNKVLRHVSEAFLEDPLRIFRVARFAAKFSDFKIAKETYDLMSKMIEENAIEYLPHERIFEEFNKAIKYKHFYKFLEVLYNIKALKKINFLNIDKKDIYFIKHYINHVFTNEKYNYQELNKFLLAYSGFNLNKRVLNFEIKFWDNKTKDFVSTINLWLETNNKIKNNLELLFSQKYSDLLFNNIFNYSFEFNERNKLIILKNKFKEIKLNLSKFSDIQELKEYKIESFKNIYKNM